MMFCLQACYYYTVPESWNHLREAFHKEAFATFKRKKNPRTAIGYITSRRRWPLLLKQSAPHLLNTSARRPPKYSDRPGAKFRRQLRICQPKLTRVRHQDIFRDMYKGTKKPITSATTQLLITKGREVINDIVQWDWPNTIQSSTSERRLLSH